MASPDACRCSAIGRCSATAARPRATSELENECAAAFDLYQPGKLLIEAALPLPAYVRMGQHGDWTTNQASILQQHGLRACALAEAHRASLPLHHEIDCLTVREEVMGSRNVDKKGGEIVRWWHKRGIPVADLNESDALLLLAWHCLRMGLPMPRGPKVTA